MKHIIKLYIKSNTAEQFPKTKQVVQGFSVDVEGSNESV